MRCLWSGSRVGCSRWPGTSTMWKARVASAMNLTNARGWPRSVYCRRTTVAGLHSASSVRRKAPQAPGLSSTYSTSLATTTSTGSAAPRLPSCPSPHLRRRTRMVLRAPGWLSCSRSALTCAMRNVAPSPSVQKTSLAPSSAAVQDSRPSPAPSSTWRQRRACISNAPAESKGEHRRSSAISYLLPRHAVGQKRGPLTTVLSSQRHSAVRCGKRA
mmetsp:Transcript_16484/g.42257  ORF Transcript_16484/g.42257 Transcript_16484/m.42257 type:complete len:215 (+) Transcript_16484:1-645(+)